MSACDVARSSDVRVLLCSGSDVLVSGSTGNACDACDERRAGALTGARALPPRPGLTRRPGLACFDRERDDEGSSDLNSGSEDIHFSGGQEHADNEPGVFAAAAQGRAALCQPSACASGIPPFAAPLKGERALWSLDQ